MFPPPLCWHEQQHEEQREYPSSSQHELMSAFGNTHSSSQNDSLLQHWQQPLAPLSCGPLLQHLAGWTSLLQQGVHSSPAVGTARLAAWHFRSMHRLVLYHYLVGHKPSADFHHLQKVGRSHWLEKMGMLEECKWWDYLLFA